MKQPGLRFRIYVLLIALVFITCSGGIVTVWYTYRIEGMFSHLLDKNIAAFRIVEELETALVNQKGFVTYFLLDADPDWLRQLGEYRQVFKERIREANDLVETDAERIALNELEDEYRKYIELKDRVIEYYKTGQKEAGADLHKASRLYFFKSLELSERFKELYVKRITSVRNQSLSQAKKLRIIAGTAILFVILLCIFLAFMLVRQVLEPIRILVRETNRQINTADPEDEVKALRIGIRGLINDFDQTSMELEKSREILLQAEKMAMVGKLAAGVAHSIRNPLTSVKMRLFSMGRALDMPDSQREDFDVISEEISHIDTIVQNFLEFSRPPKLKMQMISPSDIVDLVIQLLRHRLESGSVEIILQREKPLPEIEIDPEQIKEVLVNLVVNACEAMTDGGKIEIFEEQGVVKNMGDVVIIKIKDNGPGMPEKIQERVMQPFYTTKEEGTGLGLSIAERIVRNHKGTFSFESIEGVGTTFIITLAKEVKRSE
ncbi:MAG: MCP four helix bundle domain-containing protein [Deltaproteobacteria bacterium]|nr:MCP four helix bundle domain-containing protein [Deltaproteobacteria bacterium]